MPSLEPHMHRKGSVGLRGCPDGRLSPHLDFRIGWLRAFLFPRGFPLAPNSVDGTMVGALMRGTLNGIDPIGIFSDRGALDDMSPR